MPRILNPVIGLLALLASGMALAKDAQPLQLELRYCQCAAPLETLELSREFLAKSRSLTVTLLPDEDAGKVTDKEFSLIYQLLAIESGIWQLNYTADFHHNSSHYSSQSQVRLPQDKWLKLFGNQSQEGASIRHFNLLGRIVAAQ
ncbi:hypothetical protein I6M34_20565 [Shewanella algae]|uniref:hypothetical protein n=1 Tax=Shewanella algae TaxID=38313 RepID=UPI001AADE154|nr:hypothetical protein [Shewanella algae]MBO2605481.1 hypothetical protein [Shewanella algae]